VKRAAALAILGVERQVELRRDLRDQDLHAQPGQPDLGRGKIEQVEKDLEQGRATEIAPRLQALHQALEGQLLVRVRLQRHLPHATQQLAEGRTARQIGAQHQRVGEEADQPFDLGPVAAGDGRAHDDVVLSRLAGEERLERGEQRHEQGDALPAAERAQPFAQALRQRQRPIRALERLNRRTRPIGRQRERRRPRGLPCPVGHQLVQEVPSQPSPLPGREVRVLDGELRQG
jgi:hypothetical protein